VQLQRGLQSLALLGQQFTCSLGFHRG
jgi:hypothetical protein